MEHCNSILLYLIVIPHKHCVHSRLLIKLYFYLDYKSQFSSNKTSDDCKNNYNQSVKHFPNMYNDYITNLSLILKTGRTAVGKLGFFRRRVFT